MTHQSIIKIFFFLHAHHLFIQCCVLFIFHISSVLVCIYLYIRVVVNILFKFIHLAFSSVMMQSYTLIYYESGFIPSHIKNILTINRVPLIISPYSSYVIITFSYPNALNILVNCSVHESSADFILTDVRHRFRIML